MMSFHMRFVCIRHETGGPLGRASQYPRFLASSKEISYKDTIPSVYCLIILLGTGKINANNTHITKYMYDK